MEKSLTSGVSWNHHAIRFLIIALGGERTPAENMDQKTKHFSPHGNHWPVSDFSSQLVPSLKAKLRITTTFAAMLASFLSELNRYSLWIRLLRPVDKITRYNGPPVMAISVPLFGSARIGARTPEDLRPTPCQLIQLIHFDNFRVHSSSSDGKLPILTTGSLKEFNPKLEGFLWTSVRLTNTHLGLNAKHVIIPLARDPTDVQPAQQFYWWDMRGKTRPEQYNKTALFSAE